MKTRSALIADHYVVIEEGHQLIVFRTSSEDRIDCEAAKAIQGAVGFPPDRHGFDDFLCYRDEHGRWQVDWYCLADTGPAW